jgi:RNA 3'-terminal phosphate cyclase (ATP)
MSKILIDGSKGEGGGQILRTSFSLAAITGQEIEIFNIRAKRAKPGLMRQHLTSISAVAEVCGGKLEGAELGADRVTFKPGAICGGPYHYSIGTAGSTTLVAQTLLPVLAAANESSVITLEGGTHNGMSPSLDYLEQAFLPVLASIGLQASIERDRYGFYPAGGGKWQLKVTGAACIKTLALLEPPQDIRSVHTLSCRLPKHVPKRQADYAKQSRDWENAEHNEKWVDALCPGNVFSAVIGQPPLVAQFDSIAKLGVPAERVASKALKKANRFLHSGAAVDEHLADQLLLYMAIAGKGVFTTTTPSEHTKTNIAVIRQLTDKAIQLEQLDKLRWRCFL